MPPELMTQLLELASDHWRFVTAAAGTTLLLAWPVRGPAWFILRLPSTLLHELAHFLVALVLGARPSRLSLIPRKLPNGGYQLGAVEFSARWTTAGLVALAPLFCGLASMLVAWELARAQDAFAPGIWFVLSAAAGRPSSADWGLALRYPVSGFLAIAICGGLLAASHAQASL